MIENKDQTDYHHDNISHNETFLVNEGIDVLAAYRKIEDDAVRKAIRILLAALGTVQK